MLILQVITGIVLAIFAIGIMLIASSLFTALLATREDQRNHLSNAPRPDNPVSR